MDGFGFLYHSLSSVADGVLGVVVDLDHEPVGHGRTRHRHDQARQRGRLGSSATGVRRGSFLGTSTLPAYLLWFCSYDTGCTAGS